MCVLSLAHSLAHLEFIRLAVSLGFDCLSHIYERFGWCRGFVFLISMMFSQFDGSHLLSLSHSFDPSGRSWFVRCRCLVLRSMAIGSLGKIAHRQGEKSNRRREKKKQNWKNDIDWTFKWIGWSHLDKPNDPLSHPIAFKPNTPDIIYTEIKSILNIIQSNADSRHIYTEINIHNLDYVSFDIILCTEHSPNGIFLLSISSVCSFRRHRCLFLLLFPVWFPHCT